MKKFKFSLGTVLSYKQQVLGSLQGEHAAILAEMNRQELYMQNLQQQYRIDADGYQRRCQEGLEIREALVQQARLRALERDLEQEAVKLQQIRKKEEEKRMQVVEAKKDTSSLEKLQDKKRIEYNAAIAKSEEQFIEEFISSQRTEAD